MEDATQCTETTLSLECNSGDALADLWWVGNHAHLALLSTTPTPIVMIAICLERNWDMSIYENDYCIQIGEVDFAWNADAHGLDQQCDAKTPGKGYWQPIPTVSHAIALVEAHLHARRERQARSKQWSPRVTSSSAMLNAQ